MLCQYAEIYRCSGSCRVGPLHVIWLNRHCDHCQPASLGPPAFPIPKQGKWVQNLLLHLKCSQGKLDIKVQLVDFGDAPDITNGRICPRAVVAIAHAEGLAATTSSIARITKVPAGYLPKVLQMLGRAGLVESRRGAGGGLKLAKFPEALSVLEVVNAINPIQRIEECPLGLETHGANLCPLHKRLDEAMEHIEASFATTTIAELMAAWDSSLSEHFHEEERLLIPVILLDQIAKRLRQEHAVVRGYLEMARLFGDNDVDPSWVRAAGSMLRNHVRWEERELFPAIEASASPDELQREEKLTKTPRTR